MLGKSCGWFVSNSPLKIRVSVVQFHPWPPSNQKLRHADSTSTVEYSVICGMNIPQAAADRPRNYLLSNAKLADDSTKARTDDPRRF
jgi:hypothetical protein